MSKTLWLILAVFAAGVLFAGSASAKDVSLTPFLQAEVNEIAMLSAQANYLQQQGDPLGAALVASYIPDHQMQANLLSAQISAMGGNATTIVANEQPFLGTREAIIAHDIDGHRKVMDAYKDLEDDTTNATIDQLAMMGVNGASRHFASLQVAQGATLGTPAEMTEGVMFALTLERAAIADLQTQAARLTALGDTATANTFLAFVPQHQSQANCFAALLTQMGGDPTKAVPPQAVPLGTRDQIIAAHKTFDTQLINTYAVPIASLPQSPIRQVFLNGQGIALAMYNQFGIPIPA